LIYLIFLVRRLVSSLSLSLSDASPFCTPTHKTNRPILLLLQPPRRVFLSNLPLIHEQLDSLASEYRASFAAPSAEALQSPFKERRKILRKNRKVALSSSVFEAEVTLRADVAKALSRAKTAVTTEEDADADDNDAAAAAPAVVAATTANIAVPTLAEGGAPLVPEPISVTDPVGAPPLQPFPMSPPPTATKELEERIEEVRDGFDSIRFDSIRVFSTGD
jgi:hypothetical protein